MIVLETLIILYSSYWTFCFANKVRKEESKSAGIFLMFIALSIIAIPVSRMIFNY